MNSPVTTQLISRNLREINYILNLEKVSKPFNIQKIQSYLEKISFLHNDIAGFYLSESSIEYMEDYTTTLDLREAPNLEFLIKVIAKESELLQNETSFPGYSDLSVEFESKLNEILAFDKTFNKNNYIILDLWFKINSYHQSLNINYSVGIQLDKSKHELFVNSMNPIYESLFELEDLGFQLLTQQKILNHSDLFKLLDKIYCSIQENYWPESYARLNRIAGRERLIKFLKEARDTVEIATIIDN